MYDFEYCKTFFFSQYKSDILTRLLLNQNSCILESSQVGLVVKNPSVNAEDIRNGGLLPE